MATVELTNENFTDLVGGADVTLIDFWAAGSHRCSTRRLNAILM